MSEPHAVSRVRVRYGETDQMGVAYHAHYLVWCEIGRTDLIRSIGPSYAEMEQQGIKLAVAEATLRYSAAAHYDDELRIETRLERVQSRSVTFGYRIVLESPASTRSPAGTLLASATTVLVSIDATNRTRVLPAALRHGFDRFLAQRT